MDNISQFKNVKPKVIDYDGSDMSVFEEINNELKYWEENPLWVESKMKPYIAAKNEDGSSVYNEDQLNIIRKQIICVNAVKLCRGHNILRRPRSSIIERDRRPAVITDHHIFRIRRIDP